ncbi:MAG: hypothetical protein ACR2M3_21045 [Thermomicrobiales bacterium]
MTVMQATTRRFVRPSGPSQAIIRVLAAFALVCAMMAMGVITGSLADHVAHGRSQSSAVPDTLLEIAYDQRVRQSHVVAYLPGMKAPHPLLDGGIDPVVSPDGK